MIPTHELARTLVVDRQIRYERAARRHRLVAAVRQRLARTTTPATPAVPAGDGAAAQAPTVLGRTPSTVARRAA